MSHRSPVHSRVPVEVHEFLLLLDSTKGFQENLRQVRKQQHQQVKRKHVLPQHSVALQLVDGDVLQSLAGQVLLEASVDRNVVGVTRNSLGVERQNSLDTLALEEVCDFCEEHIFVPKQLHLVSNSFALQIQDLDIIQLQESSCLLELRLSSLRISIRQTQQADFVANESEIEQGRKEEHGLIVWVGSDEQNGLLAILLQFAESFFFFDFS